MNRITLHITVHDIHSDWFYFKIRDRILLKIMANRNFVDRKWSVTRNMGFEDRMEKRFGNSA